ncbi:MAG TPA: DUF4440 domain-containing protein [Bryobacteraceae bacterium]|nr:DUF4440 domain-containing protein [Bryobacteraceae bacterium]
MKLRICGALLMTVVFSGRAETNAELKEQVRQTEMSFAKSLADRNTAVFISFLSQETIFMSNNRALRGPREVMERWKSYFEGRQAPFSWEPEQVQVLDSGTLAMTSGPVRDPSGKRIGTFNSVWRREAKGQWKIVLDNGCPACDCAATR